MSASPHPSQRQSIYDQKNLEKNSENSSIQVPFGMVHTCSSPMIKHSSKSKILRVYTDLTTHSEDSSVANVSRNQAVTTRKSLSGGVQQMGGFQDTLKGVAAVKSARPILYSLYHQNKWYSYIFKAF